MDFPDFDLSPWFFANGTGVIIDEMKLVGEILEIDIEFKQYPFTRCMYMVRINKVDGAICIDGYSLYKLAGSDLEFTGEHFINLRGTIGTQPGFAVIKNLEAMGICLQSHLGTPQTISSKSEA